MGGSTLSLTPDAFSGRKLGKYEVLCRLSTGGMAEIFLASQRGLAGFRKLVVLKQILPDIAGEEEFVQMFLDEARVTAAFNHPHIAQVFDLDVAEGELFLAMEFVPGATLVEVAKACRGVNESIPMGFSLEAVRDTALALHYAHTFTDPLGRPSPVIHRDVAEKNIMVTYEGVTKLLDFGIAKNLARKSRTQIGMVKGTSGYMSPEQILGEQLDARSDLFSLGVVLHECLTGLRLFHAKTPEAGAGAVLQGQVPPPSRSNKAIPPELDAIVLKALSRKREDRYSTTLEFARALERAVGPLIWHPEQSAELISRLFADRREQTRQLLMAGRAMSGESTGEVNVAHILSPPAPAEAPRIAPEPATATVLPQITAALPSSSRPSSPSLTGIPSVKPLAGLPPPAQDPLQSKPPTPPRGAPPRRPTSTGLPTVTSSESPRRPVFEPIPQKRTSTSAANELEVPPPPPPENTAHTRPGDAAPLSPAWADKNSTRVAPIEASSPATTDEDDESQPVVRTVVEPLPRGEQRGRPSRMDLHLMGTLPHVDSLAVQAPPAPKDADEEPTPAVKSFQTRLRPTSSSERIPSSSERISSSGHSRPPRRRPPTPPPAPAEDSQLEVVTSPVRALRVERVEEEQAEDTNETLVPESDEAPTFVTSPTITAAPSGKRGRYQLLGMGVVGALVLVGVLAAVAALGWDGGLLGGLVGLNSQPLVQDPGHLEPLKVPSKLLPPTPSAQATAPESKPATTTTEAAPSAPTTPESKPAETTATPTAPTTPEAAAPSTTPEPSPSVVMAPPTTPPAATPSDTVAPQEVEPESASAPKAPEVTAGDPEEEPVQQPTKKPSHPSTKRSRRESKAAANGPGDDSSSDELASATSPSGGGLLTLVTTPYAKVYLGKRYLGDTPLFKINLPSGKHSLRLVGADGRSLRLPVEIKSGDTTALKLSLDQLDQG